MRSMKRVTKKLKQSLSILLAVAMVITCMPQTATAVMAAENEVVDTEGVDVNDVETTDVVDVNDVETVDVVDDAEVVDDVEVVTDTADVEEPSSMEENAEEGGDNAEVVADDSVAEVSEAENDTTLKTTLNLSDVDVAEDYTSANGANLGGSIFSLLGDKAMTVAESPASIDGFTFTKALNTKGGGSSSQRGFSFEATGNAVLTVYAKTASSSKTTVLTLHDGTTAKAMGTTVTDVTKFTEEIQAGSYTIYSTEGGSWFYYLSLEYKSEGGGEPETKPLGASDDVKWNISDMPDDARKDYTEDFTSALSTPANFFTVKATQTENQYVTISKKERTSVDDYSFTNRLALKGAVVKTEGDVVARAIQFTPEQAATLTIYALSEGSSGDARTLVLADGENETSLSPGAPADANADAKAVKITANVKAGTQYSLYSKGGGIAIFYIGLKYLAADTWTMDTIPEATYNAKEQIPPVVVKSGETTVDAGKYDVTYKRDGKVTNDFTSVGKIVVTVKGTGADADRDELSAEYIINPLTLDSSNTRVVVGELTAEGTLSVTVETKLETDAATYTELDGKTEYDVDITTLSGDPIQDLSSYDKSIKVKVTGKGNFKGEMTATKQGTGKDDLSLKLDASDLDIVQYTTANGNCENLAGSIFSVVPSIEGGAVSVDKQEDKSSKKLSGTVANDLIVTKRLKMGGKGSTEARAIKFKAEQTGVLSVYVMSSNKEKHARVVLANEIGGVEIVADEAQKTANNGTDPIIEKTVNVYAGRTYWMYADDTSETGINFYYIELVPNPNIAPEPSYVNISLELAASDFEYKEGYDQVPEMTVKFGDTVVGSDKYYVEYLRDGVNTWNTSSAGTITVKVTGNEGTECAGKSATASYVIKKKAITADSAALYVDAPVYAGEQPNVRVVLKESKQALSPSDYTLAYANAVDNTVITNVTSLVAGTKVRVTATCTGNYDGSVSGEYTVARKPAGMGDEQYEVWFNIGNVEEEYYGTFDAGSFITIPEEVEDALEGAVVEGWYTDRNFTAKSKWDLTKNIVDSSMTLYARVCTAETSNGLYVQDIPTQTYTGKDIKPAVAVYASDGKTLLKSGKDYIVTYANNKDANVDPWGEPIYIGEDEESKPLSTATITGKGNYSNEGSIVKTFGIAQISIDEFENSNVIDVKVADQLVQNSKKAQKTLSTVKVNKKALKPDVDFVATLSAPGGTDTDKDKKGLPLVPAGGSGTYSLTITGINNYWGEINREIYVMEDAQKLMKNAKIKLGKNLKKIDFNTASRLSWSAAASTELTDDTFTVSDKSGVIEPENYYVYVNYANSYEGDVTVGKAQLVIEGKIGNGYYGTKTIAFTVTGTPFSEKKGIDVPNPEEKVYTGEAIYQNDLVVTAPATEEGKDPVTLSYMYDYKISYKNNVKKGKATMTFTALPSSGYTGSIKKTFTIKPATLSYDMITDGLAADSTAAAPKMDNVPYSKVAPKPSNKLVLNMVDQNVENNTYADGVVLKEGTDYTVKYKNNNKVGDAEITLKGKGNLSGQLSIGFKVDPASLKDLYDEGVITVAVTPVQAKENATKDYAVKLKVLDTGKALKAKTDYTLSADKISATAVKDYVYGNPNGDQPEVTITGAGTYSSSEEDSITVPLSFFDKANKIAKNTVDIEVAPAVYNNGKQLTPGVTVYLKSDTNHENPLTECDETGAGDFTVTYGKNNVAGKNKGSVTVTGQGLYGGKLTVKFEILPMPINGEKPDDPVDDPFDTAFYYGYIDDQILKYINKAEAGKVDGIGTVTYDKNTHTFTVPVTDKTVNIDGTFNKLVNEYRNDARIDVGMQQVKSVFMADIEKASEIAVTASYANKAYTEKRDPEKYIEKYKDADKSVIIDDILAQYEKQISNYNKLHDTNVKNYTLDKVAGKSGSVTVKITYKNGKAPVELTYNVKFTDATK